MVSNINDPVFKSVMQTEFAEIDGRINAMEKYIFAEGSTYPDLTPLERDDASKQLKYMKEYRAILDIRIWSHIRGRKHG